MNNINYLLGLILLLSWSGCYKMPERALKNYNHARHGFQEWSSHYVRESPVTAREYLIFLCWNIDVYGDSYPEKVEDLFIGKESDTLGIGNSNFSKLLKTYVLDSRQYFFNPDYIDFPMTGLNEYQLKELYRWLTDRYNENMLISIGHMNFNPHQKDEDSYNLEASLCNYYQGEIRKDGKPSWQNNMYLPLFRPPYQREKPYDKSLYRRFKKKSEWRRYEMDKTHFLWRWNRYYLEEEKGKVRLKIPNSITIQSHESVLEPHPISCTNFLQDRTNEFRGAKYLDEEGKMEKDKYGRMRFSIIGENALGRAITQDSIVYDFSYDISQCLYWVVCNREIAFEFWP